MPVFSLSSTPEAPGSSPRGQLDKAGRPWPLSGSHAQPQGQPLHSRHFRSPCANHVRVTAAAKTPRVPTSCDKDEGAPGTEREDGVLGTRPPACRRRSPACSQSPLPAWPGPPIPRGSAGVKGTEGGGQPSAGSPGTAGSLDPSSYYAPGRKLRVW